MREINPDYVPYPTEEAEPPAIKTEKVGGS